MSEKTQQTFLDRAITDGYAKLSGEGKQQKILYPEHLKILKQGAMVECLAERKYSSAKSRNARTTKHRKCDFTIRHFSRANASCFVGAFVTLRVLMAAVSCAGSTGEGLLSTNAQSGHAIDLLRRYPTTLVAGDAAPSHARPWDFFSADIFRLSHVSFSVGKSFHIESGPADLGIGHCTDGAVWAVVIPCQDGTLVIGTNSPEAIAHIWLRFHPTRIDHVFPPKTVFDGASTNLIPEMRHIADVKMNSSWHAGDRALIPEPWLMTVDVDTKDGKRRFFPVNTQMQTAELWTGLENSPVRQLQAITPDLARAAFDQLWRAFDRDYAMFILRPEVDWAKLREEYRPQAIAATSTLEFAEICAQMLKQLRDEHVWLTLAGDYMPVFNLPKKGNSNPSAYPAILGNMHSEGAVVKWAVTDDKIGFIAIYGWNDPDVPDRCQAALEHMRDTRGLIVDVRMNPGGSEDEAMAFAGRFVANQFTYAYDQARNGPNHTNLTAKIPRKIAPLGPWRYDRPVILLIGQVCASSDESFIGMMTGDPLVTTMGDHTAGSSGNPESVELPLGLTVGIPQWIDYLPDGSRLDERGFQPQIPFTPGLGAFEGNRDDLLVAALDRLRKVPLPEKPIAGPVFVSEEQQEAQELASLPKVPEADSDRFLGAWDATFAGQTGPIHLAIKIFKANDSYRATWDSLDHGMTNLPFTKLLFTSKTSIFLETPIDKHQCVFRATLNANATELSGVWKEGNAPFPLTFRRSVP